MDKGKPFVVLPDLDEEVVDVTRQFVVHAAAG
jgi:hypothetical protein